MVLALPKAAGEWKHRSLNIWGEFAEENSYEDFASTFQDGVCLEDLLLNPGVLTADCSQVLQHQLGALSFPSSGLSAVQTTEM